MRTETFEGTIEEYQGKPVSPVIKYNGEVKLYENITELKNSEDWPGDSQILSMVNNKLKTAAKSSVYQEKTAELKKAYEDSAEFKRKNLVSSLVAAGKSKDEAEKLADSLMA